MNSRSLLMICCASMMAVGGRLISAQAPGPTYEPIDIAYGAQVYTARCSMCHGAQGDGVGNVNLRSGKFRNATTDGQLGQFIRTGSPAAGMPPFALDAADMTSVIAYLRNWNSLDAGGIKAGDAG